MKHMEVSHFSCIGMPISRSREDMELLVSRAAHATGVDVIRCKNGRYLRWKSDPGAELWIQLDKKNRFIGLTPYFRGKSTMRAVLLAEVASPDDTPLEGAVSAEANPKNDDLQSGDYPFIFDLVDKGVYQPFQFPFISSIQLSAFAHELTVYDSDDDFYAPQKTKKIKMGSESFIPWGMFKVGSERERAHAKSTAIFAGHILEARELKNPLTNCSYHWMHIKTVGGETDLVADPQFITKPVKVGGVVKGEFWLCGRILNPKSGSSGNPLKRLFKSRP